MTVRIPAKPLIALCGTAGLLWLIYYGSYLPLKKSEAYIVALRNMANFKSLDEFQGGFGTAIDKPSPIGHEELVRNLGSTGINIINQNRGNPQLVAAMVDYVESYYIPLIESGRGMSFTQNLYLLGNMNQFAFLHTRNPAYIAKAESYFKKGLEYGPRRPQFLYGLFDVYRMQGKIPEALGIGERILDLWPKDTRLTGAMEELRAGRIPPLPGEEPVPAPSTTTEE